MKKLILPLIAALCLTLPMYSYSDTVRYVSDGIEITMRNGKGVEFSIRRMLPGGTRLTILETDRAKGYARVRTDAGTVGWVLMHYLTRTPGPKQRVAEYERKITSLESEIVDYRQKIDDISTQKEEISSQNSALQQNVQLLQAELDELKRSMANTIEINNQNKDLKNNIQQLELRVKALTHENATLGDNEARTWFLIGAAVLFIGVIFGLMLPKLRFGENSGW